MSKKTYQFKCPKCGHNWFEEVMINVTVSSDFQKAEVTIDDEEGVVCAPEYGRADYYNGEVARYQCQECGEFIAEDTRDLGKWLIEHGKEVL